VSNDERPDPWAALRKGTKTTLRNQIESEALYEGRLALETRGPEAAAEVLADYSRPYSKLLEQIRLDEEAEA